MNAGIFYDHNSSNLLITSNVPKWQKNVALGIYPNTKLEKIDFSELAKFEFNGISFDEIDNAYFQTIKSLFDKHILDYIAFHDTQVDLSAITINVNHLVIGEKAKLNLSVRSFKKLTKITFLSLKTFKGKVLHQFESVEQLVIWYEDRKVNEILPMFPKLKHLEINNGSLGELDLAANMMLETLSLHRCMKLEKVILDSSINLKKVVIGHCNRLDINNLGNNVAGWPLK